MVRDMKLYVTMVQQSEPPEENQVGDPVVTRVEGGEVIVTAQAEEGFLEFTVPVSERVAVGDALHVRIDFAPPEKMEAGDRQA